eukprot:m.11570 g.11570  ORF g.11570 m.11570 type:complete len:235 (+) comp7430_c0_seq1:145-849(+)
MRVYDGCYSLCAWHSLHRPKLDVHGVFIHLTPTLTTTLRDALLGPARTCARSSHHHPDAWCRSSELVRRLNRYSYANLRCVVVKHSIDDRFAERNAETEYLSTHDNVNVMKAERVRLLGDASHLLDAADVIGIDEGQFFEDLVPFCEHAAGLGKVVVVAALDGDFLRTGFPSVVELIPKCESVVKLTAVCAECGHAAAFSRRLVSDTSTTLIGGRKEYAPVCRQHWLEPPAVTQ